MTLTDDPIREALDAVAQYRPVSDADWPEFQRRLHDASSSRRRTRRRWLTVGIAAAVAIVVGIPLVVVVALRNDHTATGPIPVEVHRASIADVSFPVPAGWSATTTTTTDTAVTVCVAATPATPCDGVTLQVALPLVAHRVTTVDSVPPKTTTCITSLLVWKGPTIDVGDRQAHGWFWKCPPDGATSVGWLADDASLAAWTPIGHRTQAATILHGVDFSRSAWSNQGPLPTPTSSPAASIAPTASATPSSLASRSATTDPTARSDETAGQRTTSSAASALLPRGNYSPDDLQQADACDGVPAVDWDKLRLLNPAAAVTSAVVCNPSAPSQAPVPVPADRLDELLHELTLPGTKAPASCTYDLRTVPGFVLTLANGNRIRPGVAGNGCHANASTVALLKQLGR